MGTQKETPIYETLIGEDGETKRVVNYVVLTYFPGDEVVAGLDNRESARYDVYDALTGEIVLTGSRLLSRNLKIARGELAETVKNLVTGLNSRGRSELTFDPDLFDGRRELEFARLQEDKVPEGELS